MIILKLIFFFTIILSLLGCNQAKKELNKSIKGNWYSFDKPIKDKSGETFINYEELYFDGNNLYSYLELMGFISPKKYIILNDSIYSYFNSENKNSANYVGTIDTITNKYFSVRYNNSVKFYYEIFEGKTIEDIIINNVIPDETKEYSQAFRNRLNEQLLKLKDTNISIKHAKGFDIQTYTNYKKLIIKSPYPDAKEQFEYIILPKGEKVPDDINELKIIRTPIEKIVVTSTTHIPMLELLNEENSLVGFPNLQYISSLKTRQLIADDKITELGNEQDINTEVLLNLQPEVVIGFSMSSNNKMFTNIEKAGIPVLLNGDWLEETPLGRAEWIKFFGVLFGKEKEVDSIFNTIEKQYKEAKAIAENAKTRPTILSGVLFKDVWNLPAGDSFVAQFLKDANTNYLWSETKGKGSLSLNFENVFEKGQHADFWIAPGHYTSLAQLENVNRHYTEFNAFKNKNIYSFANKTGENGGVLYYELAPVQPHIVLKDIIKAVHPKLLPDYKPFFLEKLN